MVGRTPSEDLAEYCRRHRISFDWMLGGCLMDLKKMVDERRGRETQLRPPSRSQRDMLNLRPRIRRS
jgi:hypothetical protein